MVTGIKREYNYDIIGRLESIVFGNNRLDYTYNNTNQLSRIKYTLNGQKRQTEYTYFKLGIPNTTKFGDGTEAKTSIKSRTLDKLGRLSGETMTTDSGVTKTTSYTYKDVLNTDATTLQVTSVTDPLGTHNYTYFEDGKLRESPGELYGYDDLGQLKTSYGPKCYWYDYDNRGNITRKYYFSESGTGFDDFGVYEYTDSEWGDLLTKYNGTEITYGALGNPLNWRDGMSFTWENDRRLVSVTRNGSSAYYTYDAGGVRRTKTVGNTSLTYEYTDGKLVSQTDGTNVWWFYYDADGTRLAMEYNGEMYYYVYNIVGDVKGMYDSEGNVVAKYSYSGYGEPAAIKDGNNQSVKDDPTHIANINPFRFKGYYFDAETEFYYLNTRYYDPYVCRFLNADAYISTGQGPLGYNMFAYCQNDPINMSDSDGKMPVRNRMLLMTDAGSYSNGKLSKSIFGAGTTTVHEVKQETEMVPPVVNTFFTVKTGTKERKTIAKKGNSSKPISVYVQERSDNIGAVENIEVLFIKFRLVTIADHIDLRLLPEVEIDGYIQNVSGRVIFIPRTQNPNIPAIFAQTLGHIGVINDYREGSKTFLALILGGTTGEVLEGDLGILEIDVLRVQHSFVLL